jgi:hypothetical protein
MVINHAVLEKLDDSGFIDQLSKGEQDNFDDVMASPR